MLFAYLQIPKRSDDFDLRVRKFKTNRAQAWLYGRSSFPFLKDFLLSLALASLVLFMDDLINYALFLLAQPGAEGGPSRRHRE